MDSRDDIPVLIQHPAELQQGFYLLTNDLNIIKSRMSEASEVIAEVSTTIAPEMAASAGQSDSVNRDISTNSSPLRDTSNSNSVLLDSIDSSFSSLDFGKKEPNISVGKIFWSCAINLFLPFVNGMMLGFGEIFAHELGFRWGWSAARVRIWS